MENPGYSRPRYFGAWVNYHWWVKLKGSTNLLEV